MPSFAKKLLPLALAGLAAGVPLVASAVNVNGNGLGQALIYPYYTTATVDGAPFNTLLSIVNSTGEAKAVKVRFTEGRNSREVLDWNLFLSPHDVWTAAIVPTAAGGAGLVTSDRSCTLPEVSRNENQPDPFVNYAYEGDGAGDGIERTQEGYIEVIEMGTLTGQSAHAVTHVNGKAPCDLLPDTPGIQADIRAPSGGLTGTATLVNVMRGQDFIVEPVALDNFRAQGVYDHPGTIKPELADADPVSMVFDRNRIIVTHWDEGYDAVSAVLMHESVVNEYLLEPGILGMTEWVFTFPTKHYYFDANGAVTDLFQRNFGASGSCDEVGITLYDREEATLVPSRSSFSPPPPANAGTTLCWESTVVSFGNSRIFGSRNGVSLATPYQAGWARVSFAPRPGMGAGTHELVGTDNRVVDANGTVTTPATVVYTGLPVVGFMARSYSNGSVKFNGVDMWANYSGTSVHRYTTDVR